MEPRIVASLIVIALSACLHSAMCADISSAPVDEKSPQVAQPEVAPVPKVGESLVAAQAAHTPSVAAALEPKVDVVAAAAAQPVKGAAAAAAEAVVAADKFSKQPESSLDPKKDAQPSAAAPAAATVAAAAVAVKPDAASPASETAADLVSKRKGRAEPSEASKSAVKDTQESKGEPVKPAAAQSEQTKKPAETSKSSTAGTTTKPKASAWAALQSKSSSSSRAQGKNKMQAPLGSVSSTGASGLTHYMSKHDAYSAIAEKHGHLAQEAMRKSDKRQMQAFGNSGIQKASGISDVLNPFKASGDSGLARSKYIIYRLM